MRWRLSLGVVGVSLILLSLGSTATGAQGSRHSLRLDNKSMYDIHSLYVSSTERGTWGDDLLGADVLRSGSEFTLTNIATGEYDLKFVDEDGDACVLRRIKITESASWKLTTEWLLKCEGYRNHAQYQLSIRNDSSFDINRIYLSPSSSTNWGRDVLGSRTLGTSSSFTIPNILAGTYDVKFIDDDGDVCILRRIHLTKNNSWTLTNRWLLECQAKT